MKLIGLMPVRNEDWVIGLSLRAALLWCDAVVVMLHNCTDETERIVFEVANETDEDMGRHPILGNLYNRRVLVHCERSEQWEEMRYRQTALNIARQAGGTHMALVDADEVLTGNLLTDVCPVKSMFQEPLIRRMVSQTPQGSILMLPWLQLRQCCGDEPESGFMLHQGVMSSGMWASQNASTAFPDSPVYHWTAGTRGGYDLHHRHPMGADLNWYLPISDRGAGLMHLQFLSRRRLVAKQFLYQLIEQKRWPGRRPVSSVREMYAMTVNQADEAKLSPVPDSWWAPYSHLLQHLHIDREPWQEKECLRLIQENPGVEKGLDDFGMLDPQSSGYHGQWRGASK